MPYLDHSKKFGKKIFRKAVFELDMRAVIVSDPFKLSTMEQNDESVSKEILGDGLVPGGRNNGGTSFWSKTKRQFKSPLSRWPT